MTEHCIKCLQSKNFKDVLTIKKDINKKLFETLFKNSIATQLTICKFCFGEFVEFISEEDLINEIPIAWLQDDDNEALQHENADFEDEIIKYEILLQPVSNKQPVLETKQTVQSLKNKYTLLSNIKNNNDYAATKRKQCAQQETQQDMSTFVTDNGNNFRRFTLGLTTQSEDHVMSSKISRDESVKHGEKTKQLESQQGTASFVLDHESDPLRSAHNLLTQRDSPVLSSKTILDESLLAKKAKQQDLPTFVIDDGSNSLKFTHDLPTQSGVHTINSKVIKEENIPIFEVEDESDNSVHFVNEISFAPTQNINDFKQNISGSEIQANNVEISITSTIETYQNSSSVEEQMRLLEEFENQCNAIEQRNETVQSVTTEASNSALTVYQNSISSYTIRLNGAADDSTNELSFICSACGQIDDKIWKIQEHVTLGDLQSPCRNAKIETHKLEYGICCEFCGKSFGRAMDLQAHRATGIHSDLMYTCPECRKCFKDFTARNIHIKAHNMFILKLSTMFMCNVGDCVKMYADWRHLCKHKSLSHIAQICPICREQFYDGRFYTDHVKNCKENEAKCEHCVKKFHNSGSRTFATHEKSCVTNFEKNFVCEKCDARFKTHDGLQRHDKNAHQPADCDYCGRNFKNKRAVIQHLSLCPVRKAKEK